MKYRVKMKKPKCYVIQKQVLFWWQETEIVREEKGVAILVHYFTEEETANSCLERLLNSKLSFQ